VFRAQIPWLYEWIGDQSVTASTGSPWYEGFVPLFWLAFALSVIYPAIAFPAFYYSKKGKLGFDDVRSRPARFPHPQFLLSATVNFIGGSMMNQIIQWQMMAMPCDFSQTPWVMAQMKSVVCLSNSHTVYLIAGFVGLMMYYPITTFMFPIMDYESTGKTWKYEAAFGVLYVQAKLVTAILTYFFAGKNSSDTLTILIQLVVTGATLLLIGIITNIMRPCQIKKINNWDICSFMIAAWCNLSGIIMLLLKNSIVALSVMVIGCVVIVAITYKVHKGRYSKKIRPKEHKDILLRYDESKEKAENPDLDRMELDTDKNFVLNPVTQF